MASPLTTIAGGVPASVFAGLAARPDAESFSHPVRHAHQMQLPCHFLGIHAKRCELNAHSPLERLVKRE